MPLKIKLIARKSTAQILGAQVVGRGGVDKRIDVLASAITAGMTGQDLVHLDLAYAPQFSHSLDAINVAGAAIMQKIAGQMTQIPAELY